MKIFSFSILLFFISIMITPVVSGKDDIKNFETLVIYIKNQEYSKENVFIKDGEIYTTLEDLKDFLNFDYIKESKKIFINGIEYTGDYYQKGSKNYVPLKNFAEYLGYYTSYDEVSNILDISGRPLYTAVINETEVNTQENGDFDKGVIIPGYGISGVIYIGNKINDIISAWGEPDGTFNLGEELVSTYGDIGVVPDNSGRIKIILVIADTYKTANGIKVGSGFQEVKAIYGTQYMTQTSPQENSGTFEILYQSGLMFSINRETEKVEMLGVFDMNYIN